MFKYASQTNPSGEQLSYRQEVYLTAGMETLPVSDITGRCMVMDMKDYCSCECVGVVVRGIYLSYLVK